MCITVDLTLVPVCDCVKPKKATGPDGLQADVLKDPIKKSLYKVIPVLVKHTHSAQIRETLNH